MELFALSESIPQEAGTVATVLIFVGFLKWAIDKLTPAIESFQQVVSHSMEVNTEAVRENHEYLKKRNGSLEKAQKDFALQLHSISETQKETAEKLRIIAEKE